MSMMVVLDVGTRASSSAFTALDGLTQTLIARICTIMVLVVSDPHGISPSWYLSVFGNRWLKALKEAREGGMCTGHAV